MEVINQAAAAAAGGQQMGECGRREEEDEKNMVKLLFLESLTSPRTPPFHLDANENLIAWMYSMISCAYCKSLPPSLTRSLAHLILLYEHS